MLLKTKLVKRIERAADKFGTSLNPEGRDGLDYKIFKVLYEVLEKSVDSEKSIMDSTIFDLKPKHDQISLILQQMNEQFENFNDFEENEKNRKKMEHNFLLMRAFKSFEKIIHQNQTLDKFIPKTRQGRISYAHRCLMRFLVQNKEQNLKLIGFKKEEIFPEDFLIEILKGTGRDPKDFKKKILSKKWENLVSVPK